MCNKKYILKRASFSTIKVFRVYLLSEKFSILRLKLSGRNFESESFAAIVDAGVKKLENKLESHEKTRFGTDFGRIDIKDKH